MMSLIVPGYSEYKTKIKLSILIDEVQSNKHGHPAVALSHGRIKQKTTT
jgi:hypothetical protein